MKKYRPKPSIFEAFQWLGNNSLVPFKDIFRIMSFDEKDKLSVACQICGNLMSEHGVTYEFEELIHPSDWILHSLNNVRYPFSLIRSNAFEELYELVEGDNHA